MGCEQGGNAEDRHIDARELRHRTGARLRSTETSLREGDGERATQQWVDLVRTRMETFLKTLAIDRREQCWHCRGAALLSGLETN